MNKKSRAILSLAVAGMVSGACMTPYAFAGDDAAPVSKSASGDVQAEAKAKCGGKDGCGSKAVEKSSCKGNAGEKNSCKGNAGEKNTCKGNAREKNSCKGNKADHSSKSK